MKLLCSILILAGIIALNDASISFEDEMRLVNDQMMLEHLKRVVTNRDGNSKDCSKTMLEELTKILGTYNNEVELCAKSRENSIKALNEEAAKFIEGYGNELQNTCTVLTTCSAIEEPIDSLNCYQGESAESAKVLTSVSNDAATNKIKLQKGIEEAQGTEDVCKSESFARYKKSADQCDSDFKICEESKKSDGGQATAAPSAAPNTEAPIPPTELPSGGEEEPSEGGQGGEGRGRITYMANKYRRF